MQPRGQPVEDQRGADHIVQRFLALRQQIVDMEMACFGEDGKTPSKRPSIPPGVESGLCLLDGEHDPAGQRRIDGTLAGRLVEPPLPGGHEFRQRLFPLEQLRRRRRAGLGPRQRDDPATGDKRGEEALPLRGEEQETNAGPGLLQ